MEGKRPLVPGQKDRLTREEGTQMVLREGIEGEDEGGLERMKEKDNTTGERSTISENSSSKGLGIMVQEGSQKTNDEERGDYGPWIVVSNIRKKVNKSKEGYQEGQKRNLEGTNKLKNKNIKEGKGGVPRRGQGINTNNKGKFSPVTPFFSNFSTVTPFFYCQW